MEKALSKDILVADDLVTCGLCRNKLVEPKLLPCQHSCCSECLEVHLTPPDFIVSCPNCARRIEVKNGDINQLPDSYLFSMIQEQCAMTVQPNKPCKPCRVDSKDTQAIYQCLDCPDAFCSGCKKFHYFSSQTEHHKVVKIKDIQKGKYEEIIKQKKMKICSKHSGQERQFLKFYCNDCQCLVCQHCVILEHKAHTCNTLDVCYEKALSDMKKVMKPLDDERVKEEIHYDNLDETAYHLKIEKEDAESLIFKTASKLHDLVENVKEEKLSEIDRFYEQQIRNIKEMKMKLKQMRKQTNATIDFAEAFLYYGSKVDIVCHTNDIAARVKDCIETKRENYTVATKYLVIDNKPCTQAKDIIRDVFGNVSLSGHGMNKNRKLSSASGKIQTRLLNGNGIDTNGSRESLSKTSFGSKVLFDNGSAMSFAYGLDFMAGNDVVAVGGTKIGVFNNDGKHKKWINCKDLKFAYDVTVHGRFIYITDIAKGQRKVVAIDPEGNVQRSIKMPTPEQKFDSFSLCVALDFNDFLFIGSYRTGTVYVCKPGSAKPEPFLTQATHPGLNEPLYLCLSPKRELIVSAFSSNNIQAYSMKGQPLWEYDGRVVGGGEMVINVPYGVCCDRDGNVYVCDHYNHRIQVVKDGTLVGSIQPQNLRSPQAITVNSNNELVIVMPNRLLKLKLFK